MSIAERKWPVAKPRKPLAKIGKKPPKCSWCKKEFVRERVGMRVCSVACSIEKSRAEQVKKACAPYRTKPKRSSNERGHQLELTQRAFNATIRERDHDQPCISCGITYGKMNAGHYRSVGAHPELRFEPLNCHRQCEQCNSSKSGNIGPYRVALIDKIGIEQVEWIEGPHDAKKYSCQDLIVMRKAFNADVRESKKLREMGDAA